MTVPGKRWTLAGLVAAVLTLLAVGPVSAKDTAAPIAVTLSGLVRGERHETVDTYQGIPYAAPPVGRLRWESPRPVAPWTTPRDATSPGSSCPQSSNGAPLPGTSEDCLYLNVTTPRTRPGARKPVLVWLHGGSNDMGSGAEFDPSRLTARGDVVVVTINYRLGMLGFLSHPELPGSGTFGLQDQQAALRWVRHNAVFFGGDPHNVTLFGESAGAIDTCTHLASPRSAGLFAKAVLQSGSCATEVSMFHHDGAIHIGRDDFWTPVADLRARGEAVARELGCATTPSVNCLRQIPAARLLAYGTQSGQVGIATGTPTLPTEPVEALAAGRFNRVPVLSGNTRDESRLVTDLIEYATGPVAQERYDEALNRTFGPHADMVRQAYPPADHGGDPALALAAMDTDRAWACPQLTTNRHLARHVPTYGYEFADRTAPTYAPFLTDLPPGAAHASELAYLFDLALGPWGPGFVEVELTPAQRRLGNAMIDAWTRFAWTGRPHPDTHAWPRFHATADAPYVQSFPSGSDDIGPVDAWTQHRCDLWADLPPTR